CIKTRKKPVSDVWSHHKAMCTCHLANIAIRLNKTLEWDAQTEMVTNDEQGRMMQAREQRKGYEIEVSV
ncbi:MAG: gfo/Idh/MocA family oxidoreductase, partial [Planctomycetaceae bacterium]|nr:gfo/Idh/MocA family oxidoreductase [Planctomycetaceae bacterium]